ncbi:MAG TPA: type II toxin-antitoxin system VapC family toxin [Candidatus Competibacter sp.]|uniref:Ribonuclease VapC n=1 Tax=Candidatus Competibacter denitrificans Run_A_D11 TaxID=1400863 RepID=W6MCU9_9GAMM|nr:type II toxin-antitoxin system VapC family toxin [Candidatus Competibacter denitrificans]CDI04355.1 PilT protein domain protein [Candidatus Competibacter denitrificans Run_A_D11]HRC71958.1 type II toxin-antitoxin system VapC family toxin [Candidatus Competibacter sp.]
MRYLLDTNIVIALMKQQASVLAQVRHVGVAALRLCAPVEAELWFGVWKSSRPEENHRRLLQLLAWLPSLPFASESAMHAGEIRATLARQGTPIGPYDLQIAAIARAHDLILVTHNTQEFKRVAALTLEDWTIPPVT